MTLGINLNSVGHPAMPSEPGERESVWPKREDFLLLKASLCQGDSCSSAWQEWKRSGNLRELPVRSLQLLPLLYRNLANQGIKDELLPELRMHYLTSLARNKGLIRSLENLLPSLHQAKIDVLVLKGVPLSHLYYRDLGARRMTDVDILVPAEQFGATLGLLKASGFVACYPKEEEFFDPQFAFALDMHNPASDAWVDLHCHALEQPNGFGADGHLWSAAVRLRIGNVECKTLSPTDHLIHAFVHGLTIHLVPPHRWVADAVTIIRNAQTSLDWARVVSLCREYGLTRVVLAGLRYVRENFGAPVPLETLGQLEKLHVPLGPWLLLKAAEQAYPVGFRSFVAENGGAYAAAMRGVGPLQCVCAVPRFVEYRFQVRRPFSRPYWLLRRFKRMLRKLRMPGRRGIPAPPGENGTLNRNI